MKGDENILIVMKKENSLIIKRNYIYNVVYQLLLIIVPLIVTPYISRKLTPEGIGQYSFSFSVISYFTIFASLGFGTYSQREIAKYQGDSNKQSCIFWEIIICRLCSVLIALCINILLSFLKIYGDYSILLFIMSINIASLAFDVAFFFQGNEQFGKIVLANSIIRIIGVISIFIFVKNENDVWKYTLIQGLILFFGYISLWIYLPKYLKKVNVTDLRPFKHLKPSIILFLPTIAISIYTVLDKTLIGLLITDTYSIITSDGVEIIKKYSDLENGFYEQSEKLIKLAMTIITCIGSVMIPRNTQEYTKGNLEQVKQNVYISSRLIWFIGVPIMFGLIAISSNIVPWFYGDGYEKCEVLLSIFSCLSIIIGFSNVFGLQYLMPCGKDWKYTIPLLIGAFINLTLNLIFIKLWWSIGAAIASIIAELCVTLCMGFAIRKEIDLKKVLFMSWKYLLSGGIMLMVIKLLSDRMNATMMNSFILIILGGLIYLFILFLVKEQFVYLAINKIKNRINNKR